MLGLQSQLLNEAAAQAMQSDLPEILSFQLKVIDLDVRLAQIAYAQLYLTTPIRGWVTAVFKEVGESVAAGEAVMRIECPDEVLLVGLVRHKDPLQIKMNVQVVVHEVYETGGEAILSGQLVAVRGHDSSNDEWEIVVRARNKNITIAWPDGIEQ